jgi:hypothetical protein
VDFVVCGVKNSALTIIIKSAMCSHGGEYDVQSCLLGYTAV